MVKASAGLLINWYEERANVLLVMPPSEKYYFILTNNSSL